MNIVSLLLILLLNYLVFKYLIYKYLNLEFTFNFLSFFLKPNEFKAGLSKTKISILIILVFIYSFLLYSAFVSLIRFKDYFEIVIFIAINLIVYFLLFNSLIFEMIYMKMNLDFVYYLSGFSILVNLVLAIVRLFLKFLGQPDFVLLSNYGNYYNILSLIFFATLFYYLKKLKRKSLSAEDFLFIGSIASLLNIKMLIIFIFISIITGGIVAIFLIIIHKKTNILIPISPFLILGYIVSLGYTEKIVNLFI